MALKMTGASLFITLLVVLAMIRGCHAAPPWTPDDFDWAALRDDAGPRETWRALYINLTANPLPHTADIMQFGELGTLGEDNVLFLPFTLGFAWQAFQVAVGIGSAITAIQGCTTTDGSVWATVSCGLGLAGTIIGIGAAYQAAKGAGIIGWRTAAQNTWSSSGLENIALNVFDKRSQDMVQPAHEHFMVAALRGAGLGEPEFLGYDDKAHRLSRRDEEHLHPRAPMYRIQHPRHGLIDIVSRDHINATRITATYANDLVKRQAFDQEGLSSYLIGGPLLSGLTVDPSNPVFNAAAGYPDIDQWISCMSGLQTNIATWKDESVMSVQLYDTAAEATFGFASLAIFPDDSADPALDAFQPSGMPLPVPTCGPAVPTG